MRLDELARAVPGASVVRGADAEVRRVVYDSRRAQPGDLFVAIPGARHDGATFAADALARGATGIVAERAPELPSDAALVVVPIARRALGDLANALYGFPSEHLRVIGVTGTDGKTTTSHLIGQVLAAAGRRVGWLTTVDMRIGDEVIPNPFGHTTPEAADVHEALARLVTAGVEDAVVEVSSHALALERVRGLSVDAAVFTNLAPEHLNFHGSMAEYAAAKAQLFAMLGEPTRKEWLRFGVVNADDPYAPAMVQASTVGIVSYALDFAADVTAVNVRERLDGTHFLLVTPLGEYPVETRMVGLHNVMNWLAAASVALGFGIDMEAVVEAAATAEPPRGRLERIEQGQPFEVVVDFAHTPQALETTLAALRRLTHGKLYLVFGMAGERDASNRPVMGELAAKLSDFFVISSDDPGPEDPAAIAAEVAAGARGTGALEGTDYVIDLDRRSAVASVIQRARPGDAILLAGKGHERRMVLADGSVPWSDQDAAREALAAGGWK